MKRFSEQFKKQSDRIRLRAAERRDLEERLRSYIEYHPLPAEQKRATTTATETLISEPFTAITVPVQWVRGVMGTLVVLLVVAVPSLAERSVPGDVLYPVKVRINEEVRSSLALSPYAKVEWETERLERRIAEARLLAEAGKLTEEIEAEVAQAVQQHTTAAQAEIAALRVDDTDEADIAEIAFASALAVQSEVLKQQVATQAATSNDAGHSVIALAELVGEAHEDARAAQVDDLPAYDKLLARVEIETTRAYEWLESVSLAATDQENADIKRRLEDVERKIATAMELHTTPAAISDTATSSVARAIGTTTASTSATARSTTTAATIEIEIDNATTAVMLLRDALTDVRKLISFMSDIDVRQYVAIDELVPVTLTETERIAAIEVLWDEAAAWQTQFEKRVVPDNLAPKVAFGRKALERSFLASDLALTAGDLDQAEARAIEAVVYAKDIAIMLEKAQSPVATPESPELSTSTATSSVEAITVQESATTTTTRNEAATSSPDSISTVASTTNPETAASSTATTSEQ